MAFLPRNKCLFISWLQFPSTVILEPKKIKSVTASTFSSSICHKLMELDAMILGFWMPSFKPSFSLCSFTLIKNLFSFSSLSTSRVMSSAYLRLLIIIPAILILVCHSSSLAFHMMYSAYNFSCRNVRVCHLLKLLTHCLCPTPTPLSESELNKYMLNYQIMILIKFDFNRANYDELLWTRNLSHHFYHVADFLKYTRDPWILIKL